MTTNVNIREIILEVLLLINRDEAYSHLAIRGALEKYQYLPKQERAFITRVCEGTIEYMIQIDYIINQFSNVKVEKIKPVIREILRSGIYQILYMDRVPDAAVCNEAVKLAQKKGFYNLKGFVNGVLRNVVRNKEHIPYPPREKAGDYLSVRYSMPKWIVDRWLDQFGLVCTRGIVRDFLEEKPTTVYIRQYQNSVEDTIKGLREQGVKVEKAPYIEGAYYLSHYNYLPALDAFKEGRIQAQDVSSMLVGEVANPRQGDFIIDLCAAPGGKSLYVADKMQGYGMVDARDVSQNKVRLIEENMQRADVINMKASVSDATIYHEELMERADIVLADVPCSGLGVMGKKTDIKYKMNPDKQKELIALQRKILSNAVRYVRTRGVLIYSTCTIGKEENLDNVNWITDNYPFVLDSLDPYLCEELKSETTKKGYLQMIPGIHRSDGFFVARLKRVE